MQLRSHYVVDALRHDLPRRIGVSEASADLALCNPPFALPRWERRYQRILARAGLPTAGAATFGADAFFIAQNLWMLKDRGELGVIVPAGLVAGTRSQAIREALLEQHEIHQVVELPPGAFSNTEVRTYLLCMQKGSGCGSSIILRRLNFDGTEDTPTTIEARQAARRMDYSHYQTERQSYRALLQCPPLLVNRGTIEMAQARQLGVCVLHTTDIQCGKVCWSASARPTLPANVFRAQRGDLLVARVGRRFFAKIAILEAEDIPISDCVFSVRSPIFRPTELFRAFTSDAGQRWLESRARGACARYITKDDLQMFPIEAFIT